MGVTICVLRHEVKLIFLYPFSLPGQISQRVSTLITRLVFLKNPQPPYSCQSSHYHKLSKHPGRNTKVLMPLRKFQKARGYSVGTVKKRTDKFLLVQVKSKMTEQTRNKQIKTHHQRLILGLVYFA